MNKLWRISVLTTVMVMLVCSSVFAIVEVEAFIKPIMDLGTCNPNADPPVLDKCGFNDYPVPVPTSQITAYNDGAGAHEVVGTVRFTAERGQSTSALGDACAGGLAIADDGDWDIPNRLFTCVDGSTHAQAGAITNGAGGTGLAVLNTLTNTGCSAHPAGVDASVGWCGVSPDVTGRLDSTSCTDRNNYTCAINVEGYSFFNYMACFPTADCFQQDPLLATTCDMKGKGPFSQTTVTLPPHDVWIAGTHMNMRLPFGARLGNTVYPGVMLNGTNQFDFDDPQLSVRVNTAKDYAPVSIGGGMTDNRFAWPAVVKSFEANHIVANPATTSPGPCTGSPGATGPTGPDAEYAQRCQGRFGSFDQIVVFVPDILTEGVTLSTKRSTFIIGEQVVHGALIPSSRSKVDNCFVDDIACVGPGIQAVNDNAIITAQCDYDTSICVDIRGSVPAMRPDSPVPYARFLEIDLEVPSTSHIDFTDQSPQVAITTRRTTSGTPTMDSAPLSFPSCDGFNFCYSRLKTAATLTTPAIYDDFPKTIPGSPKFLHIPASSIGRVTLTEPNAGYIKVESKSTTALGANLTCVLPTLDSKQLNVATGVDFVSLSMPVTSSGCNEVIPPVVSVAGSPGLAMARTPTNSTISGVFPQAGSGYVSGIASWDAWTFEFLTPSTAAAATLSFHGYDLLVSDQAPSLPGRIGCVEIQCTLNFSGHECPNHEGVSIGNVDGSGAAHRPAGGGGKIFDPLPVTCIVPGRTVLLYPFLVKSLIGDNCSSGFDTGVVVTNTAASEAIVHFYLFEEEGRTNIATNPVVAELNKKDPELLVRKVDAVYNSYNEIPRFGQYINMLFEPAGDPASGKPKNSVVSENDPTYVSSHGIFPDAVLTGADGTKNTSDDPISSELGRVWMYAVVQQCYAHGYQMVFSEGGFGSTLALVDQETVLTPVNDQLSPMPRNSAGVTGATRYIPVHTAPMRYTNINSATCTDQEVRRYQFWNGNDQ